MSHEFDPRAFLAEFLTEAAEHLGAMDDALLEAERRVAHGEPVSAELVNALFRAVHTLKGMAGMMGFPATTALAHAIEQRFDRVRQGDRPLAPSDFAPLFAGADALKRLHAAFSSGGDETAVDTTVPLAALEALAHDPAPAEAGPLLALLDEHDQTALLVEAAKGQPLYEITAWPAEHCPDGLSAWLDGLSLIGRVVGPWDAADHPVAPSETQGPVRLLLLTMADRASVLDCTGVGEANVRLTRLPWEPVQTPQPITNTSAPPAASAAPEKATSIRVETARLDRLMELMGELVIHQTRVFQLSGELTAALEGPGSLDARRDRLTQLAAAWDEALQSVARVSDALQQSTMRVRMVPAKTLFQRFPRIVRDLAVACGKSARLEAVGGDTELDKTVIEQIGDPLIHLIRNAVDHGLESPGARVAAGKPAEGVITLSAAQEGHHIVITVADDGAGIDRARVLAKARAQGLLTPEAAPTDAEVLMLIFEPGFSTAEAVTDLSGRGVGMDVVMQNIQKLGGSIQVLSEPAAGTRFVIKLPLTLAITQALLVRAGEATYVVPLSQVEETLRVRPDELATVGGRAVMQVRGEVLPVHRLSALFGGPAAEGAPGPVVIVGDGALRFGLVVDALVGQQDVVVKSLGDYLGAVSGVGGATILGDGRVALILDVRTLLDRPVAQPVPPLS